MSDSETKTILVVDDNPGTLYSTSRILRSAGYTVKEARTGAEGLAAAGSVDLAVLDIHLPDIDGFEVCRLIRANPPTARLPVIHLSATFVDNRDKVRGLNHGADGYLTHPIEGPVLIATVMAFLRARHAEDALKESERKFRAIFDQASNGIALISEDFVYLEVNPALCAMLGCSREQIIGKHNSTFMPPGREREMMRISEELKRQRYWKGTLVLAKPDMVPVDLEWSISEFTIPEVALAIVMDITERRRAEAERDRLLASERAARSEAERANRLKDDFLATVSHELRTPLNAMMGWSQILRQEGLSSTDLADGLAAIDRNVRAQSELISDLLDVSRITSGKLRLEVTEIDPSAIVDAALDAVASAAQAKNIMLDRRLTVGRKIVADPNRLQQIVWNLVNNAVKFTPAGGRIEVSTASTEEHFILKVGDTGQGILPEFLPRIFEQFSQADASSRRKHGGLGLGLAIVRNLVEMHGGTIAAESAGQGKGSTFTMVIPLVCTAKNDEALETRSAASPENQNVSTNLAGVRILLVDDDDDGRKALARLLADFDAKVFEAANVDSAIAILSQVNPQIIVTDIGMPGQDGFDFVRALRRREDRFAAIPVVAVTAFAGEENAQRVLREGFQAHLAKPVNPAQLAAAIGKFVG